MVMELDSKHNEIRMTGHHSGNHSGETRLQSCARSVGPFTWQDSAFCSILTLFQIVFDWRLFQHHLFNS